MDRPQPITQRARRIAFAIAFSTILGILAVFAAQTHAPWQTAGETARSGPHQASEQVARVDDASSATSSDDAFNLVELVHRLFD